jgi:tRNA/tmRNA/rRNA uracil-C5-methylase (TrmA/RlmC/RlmD family)
MSRHPRARAERGRSRVGERFVGVVGPVAHGGHCVVRLGMEGSEPDTRVVFTRHALPGESVVLEITEGSDGDRFWRADAVEVLAGSADRVPAPCPVAGPGLCGGCDFQHASLPAQRALKTDVVREQLVRLGRLDPSDPRVAGLEVEAVPVTADGRDDGLRWRTRVRFATTEDGRRGMRRHRSHDVVPVDDCLIAHPRALDLGRSEPGAVVVERVETAHGVREFAVTADGFWQVHPGAPRVLVETVLDLLGPRPGESALDPVGLDGDHWAARHGVGEETREQPDAVAGGSVVAVEADRVACRHARANLGAAVRVVPGPVERVLAADPALRGDVVVLDPPREGARRGVVERVAAGAPRAVAYVACDPAALARDVAVFGERGYRLATVRAFDLFPMTHHVECVALLVP